jgi:hypothetical protein
MATTGYVSYAFLNVGPTEPISNVPFNNLPLFSFSSKGGITNYGINTTTYFFFDTGEMPAIAIVTADAPAGTVFCTLNTGTITSHPKCTAILGMSGNTENGRRSR